MLWKVLEVFSVVQKPIRYNHTPYFKLVLDGLLNRARKGPTYDK